jgi:hypothetical protein
MLQPVGIPRQLVGSIFFLSEKALPLDHQTGRKSR